MKKILVALDYSPSAQLVAETGYKIAEAMNAEVLLIHIVADINYYSSMAYSPIMGFSGYTFPDIALDVVTDLEAESLRFLNESKKHLGGENIEVKVVGGETGPAILKTAEEYGADIVVMGSHGRSGLGKLIMGSVAENVLQNSKVPLLVVPIARDTE